MSKTLIKFCGITRAEDALAAVELGVDFLGFIFVPGSPRCVQPAAAAAIASQLPPGVKTVALFQNPSREWLAAVLAEFAPSLVQFHGNEPAEFCALAARPYSKAVPMGEGVEAWPAYEAAFPHAEFLLADSHSTQGGGGSGHAFQWADLPAPAQRRKLLMLAGGLTAQNLGAAIAATRPWAVDVSSGIEQTKGVKDALKMRAFVEAVRAADAALQVPPAALP